MWLEKSGAKARAAKGPRVSALGLRGITVKSSP